MIIDLRTQYERQRRPKQADVQIEVPVPMTNDVKGWLSSTLLSIADGNPRQSFQVFCGSGARSDFAAEVLRGAGRQVQDLGAA